MLPVCVPVLAPAAGPMPTVAMPGHWVCLEHLAALASGPLCSATRLGEPAPVPTAQCLDMSLEQGTHRGPQLLLHNPTGQGFLGWESARQTGMVLGFFSWEVIQERITWKGISGSQHSLRMEGKEKQGAWIREMGDQDQQDSHPDNSPSSSPIHWAGEGLEVDLALSLQPSHFPTSKLWSHMPVQTWMAKGCTNSHQAMANPWKNHQIPSSNPPSSKQNPRQSPWPVKVGDFPQQCPLLPFAQGCWKSRRAAQQASPGPPQPEHQGLCESWK